MSLLDHAIFVRLPYLDQTGAQAVMIEQLAVAPRERPPAAAPQIVGGGRQIVRTQHLAYATELPQRSLHSCRQRSKLSLAATVCQRQPL